MNLNEFHQKLLKSNEYVEASNELRLHFDLANSVLRARLNKGWSQAQLAEKIGTKQANISKIEAGLANPTLNLLQKLSNVLEINISFSCEENTKIDYESFPFPNRIVTREFNEEWSTNTPEPLNYTIKTGTKISSETFEYA